MKPKSKSDAVLRINAGGRRGPVMLPSPGLEARISRNQLTRLELAEARARRESSKVDLASSR